MKKFLKYLGIVLGSLLLLLIAAVVILPLVIDPNDYRDRITEVVKEQTGRELRIEGEIKLSVFPWLGIALGKMELSNAPGFGPEPFARLEGAEVSVKLLPLLKKAVEMDTVTLQGVEAYLGVNEQGVSNWDDLVKPAPAAAKPAAPAAPTKEQASDPAAMLAALAIGGVSITNARLVWDDRQNKQRYELDQLNLNTGALSLTEPFELELNFRAASEEPALKAQVDLRSLIGLELGAERYRLEQLHLALDAQSPLIPGGRAEARLEGNVAADLKQQTLALKGLKLMAMGSELTAEAAISHLLAQPDLKGTLALSIKQSAPLQQALAAQLPAGFKLDGLEGGRLDSQFELSLGQQTLDVKQLELALLGLQLKASVQGKQILEAPRLNGQLSLGEFVPRDLLGQLGITLPEMADPSTLTKASLETQFKAGPDHAALKQLKLRFDDSTLSGSLSATQFEKPVLRYSLALDAIDVDRYLPPPAPEQASPPPATPASAAAAGAVELPLEMLRSLDIDGGVKIGKLKVMNLHSSQVHATLKAAQGRFRVHPVGAKLYQGAYEGDLGFDVRGQTPIATMDEKLSGVQIGPLLKDFMGEDYIRGDANISAKLSARGLEPAAIRNSLSGQASFRVSDGAVNGLSISNLLHEAYTKELGLKQPNLGQNHTVFSVLSASATLKNGLVSNQDLLAKSSKFTIKGRGTAHLGTEKLDYRLDTHIAENMGESLEKLAGHTVPVHITGSFSDPKFKVDVGGVLKAKAKAKLDAEKARARQELEAKKKAEQERLKQKAEEEKKKAAEDLKQKLRDKLKF